MHDRGSLLVEHSKLNVPYTLPGDENTVTVQLTTPCQPGIMFFWPDLPNYNLITILLSLHASILMAVFSD